MKHTIADDVKVKVDVDLPTQDLEDLIKTATDCGVKLIAAYTVGKIVRSFFEK